MTIVTLDTPRHPRLFTDEVMLRIFGFLSAQDRLVARRVCYYWKRCAEDPSLWPLNKVFPHSADLEGMPDFQAYVQCSLRRRNLIAERFTQRTIEGIRAFTVAGGEIYAVCTDNRIHALNTGRIFEGDVGQVSHLLTDGKFICTVSKEFIICVWDIETGDSPHLYQYNFIEPSLDRGDDIMNWSVHDHTPVVSQGVLYMAMGELNLDREVYKIHAIDLSTGLHIGTFEVDNYIVMESPECIVVPFSVADGLLFAIDDEKIRGWETATGIELHTFALERFEGVSALLFSDGIVYAAFSELGFIKSYDIKTGGTRTFEGDDDRGGFEVTKMLVANGILYANWDGLWEAYNLVTGQLIDFALDVDQVHGGVTYSLTRNQLLIRDYN